MSTPWARIYLIVVIVGLLAGCHSAATRTPGTTARPAGFQLTNVADQLGLRYRFSPEASSPLNILQIMGGGAAFLDYDNDGWLDVLCIGAPHPALFHNEQGKRFVDVTAQSGLGGLSARWFGCATGDYDNDGFVDLFLTGYNRTALLRNNGHGGFTDVTERAGVQLRRWSTSAAFADVDHDGRLDLYVACYVRFAPGMPEFLTNRGVKLSLGPDGYEAQHGVLFHNDGSGRFHDITQSAGLGDSHGKALGVAFRDADNDGDDDLVVANDQQPLDFFENDGHGHFRNVSLENGTALSSEGKRQGGMGLDFADYDGDGLLDLFVANFADEPKSLYRNLGHGTFENAGYRAGVSQATRPWVAFGTRFADLDHDTRPDLVIANGHVQDLVQQVDPNNPYPQKAQLYLNSGGGRFREVSAEVGPDFRQPMVGRGLAAGDFDNDGDLDLLVADLGGAPHLFRNDGGSGMGHWLQVQLTGTRGNRMAIGARLELTAGGQRQLRECRTDGSYLAGQDPRVHFGLGTAATVDQLRVRWPSGRTQTLHNLPVNRLLKLREPTGS